MSKIQRYQGDVRAFASAQQSGERYIFGDTTTESDSLSDQLTPDYLRGWAVISASDEPPLEWFNAVAFTATQFISYLHQSGIPEWDGEQEYHDGSQANFNGQIYTCLTDSHTSVTTPNTDPTNWKKASAGNADTLNGKTSSEIETPQATQQEVSDGADVDAYVPPDLLQEKIDSGFDGSLVTNGWRKTPDGYIEQWGILSNVALDQTFYTVIYPIPFPNRVLNITPTISMTSAINGSIAPLLQKNEYDLVSFRVSGDYSTDTGFGDILWKAIGY